MSKSARNSTGSKHEKYNEFIYRSELSINSQKLIFIDQNNHSISVANDQSNDNEILFK